MILRQRPRRNRKSHSIRDLVQESRLSTDDLIMPLFIKEKKGSENIQSMPGQKRLDRDDLFRECESLLNLGVKGVSLFPAIEENLKNSKATESHNPTGLYPETIRALKERFPDLVLMTDVAMDPYSSDGHDGLVDDSGNILNDETLAILNQMAIVQAQAGSDIIGPSDMMDGRVGTIREALDKEGYQNTLIMSYSAKYASAFYGPFRDALESAPKQGDKKTYQMNPANSKEALREAHLDDLEGADILMIKPGLPYLDIIKLFKDSLTKPVAAYNVSGEYAMIKAAHEKGWIDGPLVMMESLLCFKRAGADLILTYFAKEAAQLMRSL